MPYPKCKIYSDGGHYIAIPHTTRPYRPRKKPKEEVIAVTEEVAEETQLPAAEQSAPSIEDAPIPLERENEVNDVVPDCTEIYSLSLNAKIDFPLRVVCFRIIYLVATIRKGD